MSKKSLLSLCVVVLLPVASYFIVKGFSANAIRMPPRYYYDTVITKVVKGKQETDTIWHQVSNVPFRNQLNEEVSLADLSGRVIVANFFFTRCPSICPRLMKNMKGLQDALKLRDVTRRVDTTFVHFVSFSVDPTRDSPDVLKKYADKNGVNHDVWWMLTGPKKTIYDFAFNELKIGNVDGNGVDSNFLHTDKFILLDKDRVVRGYYNGLDSVSLSQLAEDLTLIMLEKDKKKKRKIF